VEWKEYADWYELAAEAGVAFPERGSIGWRTCCARVVLAAIQIGGAQEDVAVSVIAVLKAIADNGVDREVAMKALDVVAHSCVNSFASCHFEANCPPSDEGDD
jgi:hypothetical protein